MPNNRTLVAAAICISLGICVLAYEDYLIGGVPILSENMDAMRMELFGVAGQGNPAFNTLFIKIIHFFVEFSKYGVFLAFIVLIQRRPKSRRIVLTSLMLMLIGTLAYISQGARTFIVEIFVTCAVLFHYIRQRIRFDQLGASVVLIFMLLGIAGVIRAQTGASSQLVERVRAASGLPEGEFWDGIGFGYLTLTESFEVFYRLTTDLSNTTKPHEGFVFYGLHRLIPRANIQEFAMDLYSGAFITPTYMGEFYADYGVGGILFGSLALGIFYGWAYSQGGDGHSLYWIYVRGLLIQMVFFFPYVNLFSQQITWILDLFFMYFLIRSISWTKGSPLDSAAVSNRFMRQSPA